MKEPKERIEDLEAAYRGLQKTINRATKEHTEATSKIDEAIALATTRDTNDLEEAKEILNEAETSLIESNNKALSSIQKLKRDMKNMKKQFALNVLMSKAQEWKDDPQNEYSGDPLKDFGAVPYDQIDLQKESDGFYTVDTPELNKPIEVRIS